MASVQLKNFMSGEAAMTVRRRSGGSHYDFKATPDIIRPKNHLRGNSSVYWKNSVFPHCLKITQNVAFEFWHFTPFFVQLKLTCLVTLFDRKLQVFKNSPNRTIFSKLLSTQNVNVARFARIVKWDFFCDFQTPWSFKIESVIVELLSVSFQTTNVVNKFLN